jgi:hypothetical protein
MCSPRFFRPPISTADPRAQVGRPGWLAEHGHLPGADPLHTHQRA